MTYHKFTVFRVILVKEQKNILVEQRKSHKKTHKNMASLVVFDKEVKAVQWRTNVSADGNRQLDIQLLKRGYVPYTLHNN